MTQGNRPLFLTLLFAFVAWSIMFSPWTAPYVDFWWSMTFSAVVLTILSTRFNPGWYKQLRLDGCNVLLGVVFAAFLWGIFWVGDKASTFLFDFARPQVDNIYGMKLGHSPWLLTGLMLFLIGPAEEIFWRGYLQKRLSELWGANRGCVVSILLYALVHIASFNFMLIMAALVAGVFWGVLYRFYPKYFGAILLSHALWDVAVFIWFPI